MAVIILLVSFLVFIILLAQTAFAVMNSDSYIKNSHSENKNLELKLLKKEINTQDNNHLKSIGLIFPYMHSLYYTSFKTTEYILVFEEDISFTVSEDVFNQLQENKIYSVRRTKVHNEYSYKWYQKPLLLTFLLKVEPQTSEDTTEYRVLI